MEYTIKTSEVLGNVASLHRVAEAMARARAMAGGKGFKKLIYDGVLKDFTATLIKAARSGHLQVCNQFGSRDNPDDLVAIARKEGRLVEIQGDADLTIAVNVYVNIQQLNTWAAALDHTFSINHDGVPWIDETGWNNVVDLPPNLEIDFAPCEVAEPEQNFSSDSDEDSPIRYELLASRTELINAFGRYGVELKIFRALKDRPGLMAARRIKGRGQRGSQAEPMFCPLAVMNWLVKSGVSGKPRLSEYIGWHILEKEFPSAYAQYSMSDPR